MKLKLFDVHHHAQLYRLPLKNYNCGHRAILGFPGRDSFAKQQSNFRSETVLANMKASRVTHLAKPKSGLGR